MPLSSYNVNQQLVTRIQQLLTQTAIPFPTLKSYITARNPLDGIHQSIVMELNQIEAMDKEEAKANLEQLALEKQRKEDKEEKNRDERDSDRDDLRKAGLINDRAINISLQFQLQTQLGFLEQQIALRKAQEANAHQHPSTTGQQRNEHGHPSESTPQTHEHSHPSQTTGQTHEHGHPSQTHEHGHPSQTTGQTHEHGHPSQTQIDPNVMQAQNARQQLSAIGLKLTSINSALIEIEQQEQQRKERRIQREARLEAQLKLAQHKSGVSIEDALSSSNRKDLKNQISTAHQTLSSKSASLINDAKYSNYSVFIQQLESSLSTLNYSAQEKEAVRAVLDLMKQYQLQTNAANNIQIQLNQTISTISSAKDKLQRSNARVILLKQKHPNLLSENSELTLKNSQLEQAQKENSQARDKFSTPAWILAGLTIVTSIPLVLALSGVITTAATASALLYTLLSIIPGLSFATSLGLGITALVYGAKASGNRKDILANENTIQANINQMGRNQTEVTELQTQTIPNCIKTIDVESLNQIKQEALLQEKRLLAQQTLQQAQAIEPTKALYPTQPPAPNWDVPPTYDATNRNAFFSLVPYHARGSIPKPSAPPIELMDAYSYH